MQLQIYYMTLIESRDILRKEGLIKSPERFSDFLETVGSKSFKEKNENFNLYDKNQKYRDLFKDKKEQKIEKKIELQSPVKLGATQMRRDSDGELNSQENSEDRKSKESLSDREDIN